MTISKQSYSDFMSTPVGVVEITASEQGVTGIYYTQREDIPQDQCYSSTTTDECKRQLMEYFGGERAVFDLPLDAKGTDFQRSVWQQLLKIKCGVTASYKDVANEINNPKAVRAVGAANGKNPISIVVPCHRVIGSNNTLTGYAGGLERKSWLLEHERNMKE
jgi:methylated-DNA-[protein]-cysteine S-methyltransferase